MKKIVLVILLGATLNAQTTTLQTKTAFAFEQVTFTNVSTAFTAATYNPVVAGVPSSISRAELATMVCETSGASIRARWDGVAPTSSVGTLINQGDSVSINGFGNIANFKGVRTSTTSVVCDITYYRASSNQ